MAKAITEEPQTQEDKKHHYGHHRSYWAIWLILLGVIFLLENLGIIPEDMLGKLWPLFLILFGVIMLFR